MISKIMIMIVVLVPIIVHGRPSFKAAHPKGKTITGKYTERQPDGMLKITTWTAGPDGFHTVVKYVSEANPPVNKVKVVYPNGDVSVLSDKDGSDNVIPDGEFKVLLPDGRLMVVTYTVDAKSGFVPTFANNP